MKKLIITTILLSLTLSGCFLKPYTPDVQQGNIINPTMLKELHVGMSKQHVRFLLGDPILRSTFDRNYMVYAYTKQINGGRIVKKQLVLHFRNDGLVKIEEQPAVKQQ